MADDSATYVAIHSTVGAYVDREWIAIESWQIACKHLILNN